MNTNHQKDFEQIVKDAGIPTDAEAMRQQWNQINREQGSRISNDSKWSPFWRLISEIVTKPGIWVTRFLVEKLLPNTFVKTASGVFLDILAWSMNLERKAAIKAAGLITFTRESVDTAVTIPAGTRIQSTPINGQVYQLVTLAEAAIPDGTLTIDVPCEASKPGQSHNLAPGYYSILPVAVAGVASVTNGTEWLNTPGADPEADDELRLRCRNQFTAVGLFHHDAAYKQIIGEFAGIRTDFLFFEHNAPRGPGSANCYIMLESGIPPQEFVDSINKHINDNGYHGHGDSMICYSMPSVPTDIRLSVWPRANLTKEERERLKEGIENYIKASFRQNNEYRPTQTWPNSRFSFSRLTQELHRTFPEIDSLDVANTDIVTALSLATLNKLTVTMEA